MLNKELQEYLAQFPDDIQVKFIPDPAHHLATRKGIYDFNEDAIMLTSHSSYVDKTAPKDEWDCEDGKIRLGNSPKFLLINPIIL